MSYERDPTCHGVLLQETPNAFEVWHEKTNSRYWIPRSPVGYLKKYPRLDGRRDISFTLPEWLIEKKQCWDLVP